MFTYGMLTTVVGGTRIEKNRTIDIFGTEISVERFGNVCRPLTNILS